MMHHTAKVLLPLVTSALACASCVLDDANYKVRGTTVPEQLADGWVIDTPANVGLDPKVLSEIHDHLLDPNRYQNALGFLVIKDGKLVFETYLRSPADRDHVHHIQSATKSVTSMLFGIGRDQGWIPDLDTPLCSILSDECAGGLDPRKQTITLRHLLTMRSGLDFDNSNFSVEMWVDRPADPIGHILGKPLFADPGQVFRYRDCDPQLVGYAMQRLSGRSEESLARQFLFEPLGISDWYWDHGEHGESMGAHGLHLRPRDLAKLGQLMLNDGQWNGTQVVSKGWKELSTSPQVVPDTRPDLFDNGFYWWLVKPAQGYAAWGHGGQYSFVVPAKKLVLVLVGMPDADGFAMHTDLPDFVELTRPLWQ